MQCDNGLEFDQETLQTLVKINGQELDLAKTYRVAVPWASIAKYNTNPVLKCWLEENPGACPKNEEAGIPAKVLLIRWFCKNLLKKLPSFDNLDADNSNYVDKDEVEKAWMDSFGLDADGDGVIETYELLAVKASVKMLIESVDTDGDGQMSREEYDRLMG